MKLKKKNKTANQYYFMRVTQNKEDKFKKKKKCCKATISNHSFAAHLCRI